MPARVRIDSAFTLTVPGVVEVTRASYRNFTLEFNMGLNREDLCEGGL